MDNPAGSCVLVFVKYPADGRVKTRLAAELDSTVAVDLYRCFVLDTLLTLQELEMPFKICYSPDSPKEKLRKWLGEQYSYLPQFGDDLGERMNNAFLQAFKDNFSRVIIIGSDSPDLPTDFLEQAFCALESHDAVLGPTSDGGYYLIGFTKSAFLPRAFESISWSSNSVFRRTIDILKQHDRNVYLLPQWHDVDTLADIKPLLMRNKNTAFSKSRTFACLTKNSLGGHIDV